MLEHFLCCFFVACFFFIYFAFLSISKRFFRRIIKFLFEKSSMFDKYANSSRQERLTDTYMFTQSKSTEQKQKGVSFKLGAEFASPEP